MYRHRNTVHLRKVCVGGQIKTVAIHSDHKAPVKVGKCGMNIRYIVNPKDSQKQQDNSVKFIEKSVEVARPAMHMAPELKGRSIKNKEMSREDLFGEINKLLNRKRRV